MGTLRNTLLAALLAGAATTGQAALLTATNNTFGNFDPSTAAPGSGTRALQITGGGSIADVDILIDFAKCDDPPLNAASTACVGQGSAFAREIVFRLTSPGGTTVSLVEQDTYFSGQSGPAPGARVQVLFDDDAANPVGGNALVSGTFFPVGLLSAFNGEDAFGTWTLFIQDTVGLDPLSFFSAELRVRVPEPGSLALLGLGLAGFAAARRRKAA